MYTALGSDEDFVEVSFAREGSEGDYGSGLAATALHRRVICPWPGTCPCSLSEHGVEIG